jgi:hypothetical protein
MINRELIGKHLMEGEPSFGRWVVYMHPIVLIPKTICNGIQFLFAMVVSVKR